MADNQTTVNEIVITKSESTRPILNKNHPHYAAIWRFVRIMNELDLFLIEGVFVNLFDMEWDERLALELDARPGEKESAIKCGMLHQMLNYL